MIDVKLDPAAGASDGNDVEEEEKKGEEQDLFRSAFDDSRDFAFD